MDCTATRIPYGQTKVFSHIILDYLNNAPAIQPFYINRPDVEGLRKAIEARQQFPNDRNTLVAELQQQYKAVNTSAATSQNLALLASGTTFTITTAHQPNIFTGPLYFLYKILHAIRLADSCKTLFPEYDFIPVYYMGSEDADLDELGHFYINGEKHSWNTSQKGAVGRMKVDKALLKLLDTAESQLSVLPHGESAISLVREHYKEGTLIQDATFALVNALFGSFGLVVLIPDNAKLKKQMSSIFKDDLLTQQASALVEPTAAALKSAGYKVQANPREINLFYLDNNLRGRIEKAGERFLIHDSDKSFTTEELLTELDTAPERFSPNVILRGIYQETILPNIAFIGGGGETAYWLQLKELFAHYHVPFPVLVLRNSFMVINKKIQDKIRKLGFSNEEIFLSGEDMLNLLVTRESDKQLKLNGTLSKAEELYDTIRAQATSIDKSLEKHVEALKTRTIYRLQELEKKMLRAEKRKYEDGKRQIAAIRQSLFPNNNLQERVENFMSFYAVWGEEFIAELYTHSLGLDQEFVIIEE